MSWTMSKALEVMRAEINAAAPQRSRVSDGGIGDARHAASVSDHNPCKCCRVVAARDFTHDPEGGFDATKFAEFLRQRVLAGDQRVKYVIWNKRIFSGHGQPHKAGEWRPYSGSNPHTKHVHVSLRHAYLGKMEPWGWNGESTRV